MDSLSQAALGAAVSVVLAGKKASWKVALLGAVIGTVPDLDVLLSYDDPVDRLILHRSFTHSLFVLIPFSGVLAWFIRIIMFKDISAMRLWFIVLISLVTHPLLDCFTSYGTGLFWPFFESLAIGSIFIIDPFYTLPLIIAFCLSYKFHDKIVLFCSVSLLLSSLYLAWSVVAQKMIESKMELILKDKNIKPVSFLISPTPFNTIFWRILIKESDESYFEGFVPIYKIFNNESVIFNKLESDILPSSVKIISLQKLKKFTNGYLYFEIEGKNILVSDMRLGMYGYYPFCFIIAENVLGGIEVLKLPVRYQKQIMSFDDLKGFITMLTSL